jgi:hypothetical protein
LKFEVHVPGNFDMLFNYKSRGQMRGKDRERREKEEEGK